MSDYHAFGNNLLVEISNGRTTADEFSLGISILFIEPQPNERDTYRPISNEEEEEPDTQTSTKEIFGEPDIKSRKVDSTKQKEFFWALMNDEFENFVELIKDTNVKLGYNYSKPKYPENGKCIEIASRLPNRSKYVKALLDYNVSPNINEVLTEPIHYAAINGNSKTLKILLDCTTTKTNINAVDKDGRTALHLAVKNYKTEQREQYTECVTMLLNHPHFDINKPNHKGLTAIHEAANNSEELVELFLRHRYHDLDLDTYSCNGRTAREFISDKYKGKEWVNSLPNTWKENQISPLEKQLLRSLQGKKLEKFREILHYIDNDGNARIDPNKFYGRPYNATCLEIACMDDDKVDFVKLLLKAGADPNIVNPITKQIPLLLALKLGYHNIPSVLLKDQRTNVNVVNDDGKTILHIIAEWTETTKKGQAIDILKLCLQKGNGIKINLPDYNGQTAIEIALLKDNKDFLEHMLTNAGGLLDLDAVLQFDNNVTVRDGIRNKYSDLEAKLPLTKHIVPNDLIATLFDHLYNKKIDEFVNILHQNENLDINRHNGYWTLLQYAVRYGLETPVKELLKANADPNKTTQFEKRAPIIIASQRKNQNMLRILLETKFNINLDVNAKDIAGNTALHHAAKHRNLDNVMALLRCGAKILHKNLFGKSHLPADSINSFLDEGLKSNGKFPDDEKYEIIFDYNFLLAYRKEHSRTHSTEDQESPLMKDVEANKKNVSQYEKYPPEMDFLHCISKSYKYREIMEHPIISSFLHIKWDRIKIAFLINFLIYLSFALLVNIYIIKGVGKDDLTKALFDKIGLIFIWLFLTYFWILEIIQLSSSPKTYFKSFVNILDLVLIIFTAALAIVNFTQSTLIVIVILASWTELMLMTSRVRRLSSNIKMLQEVIINYFWLLVSFIYLIIAFGISFYSVYHAGAKEEQRQRKINNTENEENLQFYSSAPLSIIKTVIMMVGEFEANNLLKQMESDWIALALFILFVFLIPMVLLNLLTGVAVSDTQTIKENDNIYCLVSRIELIHDLEKNLTFLHNIAIRMKSHTPKLVGPFLYVLEVMLKRISLFSDTVSGKKHIRIRPNEFKYNIIDHNGNKTKSELNLKILKKALEIISERHEKIIEDEES